MRFIVFLGPKHSGKTSAGHALAESLSCGFVDLDGYITQRSGKSPRELYVKGAEVFRKAEAEALAALFEAEMANPSPLVVAFGGGLADNPDALSLLEKNEGVFSIFLDVSASVAWERISRAGELPPFLKTENPQETHRVLHERRSEIYRHIASLTIQADGKSPQEIAEAIKAVLACPQK